MKTGQTKIVKAIRFPASKVFAPLQPAQPIVHSLTTGRKTKLRYSMPV